MKETRSYKEQNDREFGQSATISLDLGQGKGLKVIPKEVQSKIIIEAATVVAKKHNLTISNDFLYGHPSVSLFGFPIDSAMFETFQTEEDRLEYLIKQTDPYLNEIARYSSDNLNRVLEEETKQPATSFFRTMTLFESSVQRDSITLTWS